jgi:chorismate mutase
LSVSEFVSNAEEHLGKPYRLGGNGKKTMDCSQLVVESLKTAGVVSESFDTTAAGFYSMSSKKKLGEVQKGDLLFWHNKRGHVTHVAIALSAPDQKGYVEIIDASASKKSVAKRKFHTNLAGLSAGYLPFVGTPASDPLPVYAQAAPKPEAKPVAQVAPTPKAAVAPVKVSVASDSVSKLAAKPVPKAATPQVRLAKATVVDFPTPLSQAVQESHSARTPVQKVESRVSAKVVDLTSRIADAKTAESVRESLSKRSIVEQIDYYRAQARASNDSSFSVTASKLELVKLHGERKLVSENIARYKAQAAKSVPGAFETVVKLNKVASILDQKIGTLALALEESSSQVRRAA